MTLLELADACERAKGADRELDIAIKVAVGHPWDYSADWGVHGVAALPYTASLDAAMRLVPEEWHINLQGVNDAWWCLLTHTPMQSLGGRTGQAKTAPLTLCAAALRARHAMESE